MYSKTGRPPKGEQTRTGKITIRVSEQEAQEIQMCADALGKSRTDTIIAGIKLLKVELGKK